MSHVVLLDRGIYVPAFMYRPSILVCRWHASIVVTSKLWELWELWQQLRHILLEQAAAATLLSHLRQSSPTSASPSDADTGTGTRDARASATAGTSDASDAGVGSSNARRRQAAERSNARRWVHAAAS